MPFLGDIPGLGRLFRSDAKSNVKRNLLVFIHPTIVGGDTEIRRLSQQRYDQLYSLQLAMDKDGNFAKLPANVDDVFQQRLPITSSPNTQPKLIQPQPTAQPSSQYQKVPAGGVVTNPNKSNAVTTPVAEEPNDIRKQ